MQSQTLPQGPFPIQHAFVVQFAAETTLDATDITGRVEHLVSGHATRFASLGHCTPLWWRASKMYGRPPSRRLPKRDV